MFFYIQVPVHNVLNFNIKYELLMNTIRTISDINNIKYFTYDKYEDIFNMYIYNFHT